LGWCFYQANEIEAAWFCFEAARKLSPDHESTVQIDFLEKNLIQSFPYFF